MDVVDIYGYTHTCAVEIYACTHTSGAVVTHAPPICATAVVALVAYASHDPLLGDHDSFTRAP